MKTNRIIFVLLLACIAGYAHAQQTDREEHSLNGKFIVTVFGNFHSGFGEQNDDRGFALDRSYLGYQCSLPANLELKAVMDVGQSDDVNDYHHIAYIKNAMLTWTHEDLKLHVGLIPTTQFNMQEKFWGYRYVLKSFQDVYKFGSSADLGISASYQLADWVAADAIVVNGEGYKKVQVNDGLLYGAGITLTPFDGWAVRVYGSMNEASDDAATTAYNLATFIGYRADDFSIGAEYNHYANSKYVDGRDQYGVSVYASGKLTQKWELYARYDNLMSNDDWNLMADGQFGILGAQVKLGKYVKLSPNVRLWSPAAEGSDVECSAYISCSFGL